jgi:SAM-dependent methyltransferase
MVKIFYYKLFQFDFLHLQKLLDDFIQSVNFCLNNKTNLKIIDIGCGNKPYQFLFKNKFKEYIGVDIVKTEKVDIVASAENLPFEDNYFDVAVSTQSLEHTKDYVSAINETHRVIKQGGVVFFSLPGVWEIHGAPHDYWRFTNYGLKEAFKKFREVKIINNGGAILCFFQILNIYLKKLKRIPILNIIVSVIIIINNFFGWYLDKLAGNLDFFVINYLVIAKK